MYEPHRSDLRQLVEEKIQELTDEANASLFAAVVRLLMKPKYQTCFSAVAKVLNKKEIPASKDAQASLDKEWGSPFFDPRTLFFDPFFFSDPPRPFNLTLDPLFLTHNHSFLTRKHSFLTPNHSFLTRNPSFLTPQHSVTNPFF